jgi:hypothetical protein
MKQALWRTQPALIAATLLAAAALTTHAQSWQPVLDLGPGTSGRDVKVNPFPNDPLPPGLLLAAYTSDYGYAILDADLTQNPPSVGVIEQFPSRLNRLGFDSYSGALFASGQVMNGNETAWEVRCSLNGGANWVSLDSGWQLVSGKAASALGSAVDLAGNLLVCGRAANGRGLFHPIIRRSVDGGANWENKVLSSKGGNFDNAADIQFVPPNAQNLGGIFAVGRVGNNWTVWRSRDGGVTWLVVHSWVPSKGIAEATAITSDANGNIYVGGMGNRVNYPRNWYVWESTDGGNTWQDLGCPLLSGTDCIINGLAIDPTGANLLVVGTVSQFNWKMQRWSPVGGWSQAVFPYGNYGTSGPTSKAVGVASDATTGLFYVTGWASDTAGQSHATVLEVGN